jgi:hypothetical protein
MGPKMGVFWDLRRVWEHLGGPKKKKSFESLSNYSDVFMMNSWLIRMWIILLIP